MPSSTLVACRASVMLGSLVAVPAAALFWPSFPTTVDSLLASVHNPHAAAGDHVEADGRFSRRELAEAPRFEPAAPRGPFDFAQTAASSQRNVNRAEGFGLPTTLSHSSSADLSHSGSHPRQLAPHEQPRLIPVGGPAESTPGLAQQGRVIPTSFAQSGSNEGYSGPANRMIPAGTHPTSLQGGAAPLVADQGMRADAGPSGQVLDTLPALQNELRRRGVTYSLLETWGPQGNQFRFHCKVAVAGNTRYSRHFEATDVDPLTAMRLVLSQVQAWQSGRSF